MEENQPRVALYVRFLYGGGAERIMVNLAQGFTEKGIAVDLILNNVGGPFMEEIPPQVRIINLNTSRLWVGLPKLIKYLQENRPLALLSTMHYTNEIAIIAKHLSGTSTRVIVSEQNTLSLYAKHQTSSERWSPIAARFLYPWADDIITCSQGAAEDLAQITGLPPQRIKIIYNPVIVPDFEEKAQEPIEHPWFQPGEPPVILGMGRLTEQKQFESLIRAFAQVKPQKSARLMIFGKGPDREKLNQLVRELGLENEVTMPGFTNNPYNYLAKSAVFVLSSAWEGLPTVLIKAMAVGTPVVSTNCPNGPEEILDGGKYGELVAVGDVDAIAKAILKVLAGDVKPVDSAWLEQFTLETSIQKYLQVLHLNEEIVLV